MENVCYLQDLYVSPEARGTGLGLAICAKIIEDHGGQLELADNPDGPGAMVIARISRHLAAEPQPGRPLPAAATTSA